MVKQINKLPDSGKKLDSSLIADAMKKVRPGNLIVLTGPSGVGKGTLTRQLLEDVPRLLKSVSVTTRTPREGEIEGVDYFFRDPEEFESLKAELLEWAEFAGNCYGTPEAWVDEQLTMGNDVLLEIEVQGAHQIRKKRPSSLLIFVSPPSIEDLRERLIKRGTEDKEKMERRLAKAEIELTQKHDFHYEVINDDIEEAVNNLRHIVYAERCRIRK
jgi:guanylate kinase